MSSYLYELPTTGATSFADFCTDHTSSYATFISDATQARANMRAALKESKRTDGEKDSLRLVKVVDDYLPYLFAIVAGVSNGEITLRSEPTFSWRTTLSSTLLSNSPRLSLPSLQSDLAFTLLTLAFALSNHARSIVTSVGVADERVLRTLSEVERKERDEKINFSVTLLCRASGVFAYVSRDVLGTWNPGSGVQVPPDLTVEVTSALSKMALADAQTLAIRKLLSKSASDAALNPGPPLPKSHPSPALLAKLHLECSALYSSARALAKTPGSSSNSKGKGRERETEEVAPELRRYLADATQFHSALGRKWLGVDAGERSRSGEAVGFLAWAKTDLDEIKDGGKGLGIGKGKERKERTRERVAEELGSVNVFLANYKKVNDSLHFQRVPSQADLQAVIPAGRSAIQSKTYEPPMPAFGLGSLEYIRRQAEDLEPKETDSNISETNGTATVGLRENGRKTSYAGAGSYY